MVKYKHIAVKEETKEKLEKGMSRGDTWDSYLNSNFTTNDSTATIPTEMDYQYTLSFNGEDLTEDEIMDRLNAITSSPAHDCFDNSEVRSKIKSLEAKLKEKKGTMNKSIDSLLLDFEEFSNEYIRKHPTSLNEMRAVREWLEGKI